jgi:hypothetical protein
MPTTTLAPAPAGAPELIRLRDELGRPIGPDDGLIICSECGEAVPVCPDLCGTLGGTFPAEPPAPRRRPYRILPGGLVAR